MPKTTVRILFRSADWQVATSADIEEPLDESLIRSGTGEITSGGVGPEGVFFNVEVEDEAVAIPVIQRELQKLGVPRSTRIEGSAGSTGAYEEI